MEIKSPQEYEKGKETIEGQLFTLAQQEEKKFNTKVKYLVYYTAEIQDDEIIDRAIIIDFEKYKTFNSWEKAGNISVGYELTPGYGEPKKQALIKGDKKHENGTIFEAEVGELPCGSSGTCGPR